jgi:hypothetical protein
MPEGQLAPERQERGHIIDAIASLVGMAPWLRGEWTGESPEANSPMYGRKWGEAPMADILGMISGPEKGAMAAAPFLGTVAMKELLDAYPALRKLRSGLSSVGIEDTVKMLNKPRQEVHDALLGALKQGDIELIAHGLTSDVDKNTLMKQGGDYMGWWRPKEKPQPKPSWENWSLD